MTKFSFASTRQSDLRHVVGFDILDPFFWLDNGVEQFIWLDHREYGLFAERGNQQINLQLLNPLLEAAKNLPGPDTLLNKAALLILEEFGPSDKQLNVPNFLPLSMADFLRANGYQLTVIESLQPSRIKKDEMGLAGIRDSLQRTHIAFKAIEDVLAAAKIVGDTLVFEGEILTSEKLKALVDQALFTNDMISSEGLIIASGAQAAIPHHPGHGPLRPHQTIVCDIYPRHRLTGYFADMTRTYVKGEPSAYVNKMYQAVKLAQAEAMAQAKPGVNFSDLHNLCVDVLLSHGFHVGDEGFTHATGHGLGLDVHELPYINASYEGILETGHVITIEPGLYYAEHGGIRLEDVIAITDNGSTNLTDYPHNFIIP
jgi:Xaa-Pro aminopeptidase